MEEVHIILLDKSNAAPFAPYLLPQVRYDIGAGADIAAFGAIQGDHAVGAVAIRLDDAVLRILSLYVDVAARRQGIGSMLMEAVAEALAELGDEIRVIRADYMVDEEDSAVIAAFLNSLGFSEPKASNRLFSVDTAKLHRLPLLREAFSANFAADPHVHPYSDITPGQLAEVEADESVLPYLKPSAMRRGILRQGSTIWVEDGHVLAWVLDCQSFDGEIVLSAACKRDGAPKNSFLRLLQAAANRCYLMMGRDFTVYISAIDEYPASLIEKISGGMQKEYKHYSAEIDLDMD